MYCNVNYCEKVLHSSKLQCHKFMSQTNHHSLADLHSSLWLDKLTHALLKSLGQAKLAGAL